jgi:hypothetical protein
MVRAAVSLTSCQAGERRGVPPWGTRWAQRWAPRSGRHWGPVSTSDKSGHVPIISPIVEMDNAPPWARTWARPWAPRSGTPWESGVSHEGSFIPSPEGYQTGRDALPPWARRWAPRSGRPWARRWGSADTRASQQMRAKKSLEAEIARTLLNRASRCPRSVTHRRGVRGGRRRGEGRGLLGGGLS